MCYINIRVWVFEPTDVYNGLMSYVPAINNNELIVNIPKHEHGPTVVLMHYINARDASQQPIFEADIIKSTMDNRTYVGVVTPITMFDDYGILFYRNGHKALFLGGAFDNTDNMHVVGNIYEHPNLVKKHKLTQIAKQVHKELWKNIRT